MSKKQQLKRKGGIVLGGLLLILTISGSFLGFSGSLVSFFSLNDEEVLAQTPNPNEVSFVPNSSNLTNTLLTVQENSLLPMSNTSLTEERIVARLKVVVTAYSSSPWETDDTPHITASGAFVREGIAANNLLPFGTKFTIPEIFGQKLFIVEDRLNSRKGDYHIDIWFSTREKALNFGTQWSYIEILPES